MVEKGRVAEAADSLTGDQPGERERRRIASHDPARDTIAGRRQHRRQRGAVHQSPGRIAAALRRLGRHLICSVKSVIPGSDIKKKAVVRAVIVRCKQPTRRPDGSYIRFDSNAAVIIDNERNPRGTRIFGAVARELRERTS